MSSTQTTNGSAHATNCAQHSRFQSPPIALKVAANNPQFQAPVNKAYVEYLKYQMNLYAMKQTVKENQSESASLSQSMTSSVEFSTCDIAMDGLFFSGLNSEDESADASMEDMTTTTSPDDASSDCQSTVSSVFTFDV